MNEQLGGAQKPLTSTRERHVIIFDSQYLCDTRTSTHARAHTYTQTRTHTQTRTRAHTHARTNTLICMDMFQPIQEHSLLYQPATPMLQNSALCTHRVPLCILTKNINYSPKQDYLVGLCNGHPMCFP